MNLDRNELEFKERRPRRGFRDDPRRIYFSTRLAQPQYRSSLRSGKPQCMFKVISQAKGAETRRILRYIARVDKENFSLETESGSRIAGKDEIEVLYQEWRQDFERKKPGRKREPKHVTHFLLSAKTDGSESSASKVEQAARLHLAEALGEQGYEYAFVLHRDTEHPHVHVVVKNYNRITGRKFHMNKAETFMFRTEWGQMLERCGIEAVATLRRDRTDLLKNVAKGIEQLGERTGWHQAKMKSAPELSLSQRMQMSKRIIFLKSQVKQATVPFESIRRQQMKSLRELDARIRSGTPEEIRRAAGKSISTIGRDISQAEGLLFEMMGVAPIRSTGSPLKGSRKRQNFKALIVSMKKDVKSAELFLKQSKLPAAEKKKITEELKRYSKAVQTLGADRGSRVRAIHRAKSRETDKSR